MSASSLVRIRFQETWDEQLAGYLPDAYVDTDVPDLMPGFALKWFGHTDSLVVQDPDTPAHRYNSLLRPSARDHPGRRATRRQRLLPDPAASERPTPLMSGNQPSAAPRNDETPRRSALRRPHRGFRH